MSKKRGPVPPVEEIARMLLSVGIGVDVIMGLDPAQLHRGYEVELEHWDTICSLTSNPYMRMVTVARIAVDHLLELPDYYTRLDEMEEKGERFWRGRRR